MKLTQIKGELRRFQHGVISVYFSYETPIAFLEGGVWFISQNQWTRTTGKHLAHIKQTHPTHIVLTIGEFDRAIDNYL